MQTSDNDKKQAAEEENMRDLELENIVGSLIIVEIEKKLRF